MNTKILEDILFQVYELGVQQTDCDLTKKANTIMMLTNKRVIEELHNLYNEEEEHNDCISKELIYQRLKELK